MLTKISKGLRYSVKKCCFCELCLLAPTQPLSHWRKALKDLPLIKEMNVQKLFKLTSLRFGTAPARRTERKKERDGGRDRAKKSPFNVGLGFQ